MPRILWTLGHVGDDANCRDSKEIVIAPWLSWDSSEAASRFAFAFRDSLNRPSVGGESLAIAGYRVEVVERGKERAKG